ncbi:SusC/RagA family TonB-linked outer membrane protein [Reichenbachiella sp.]|uniref:SusC/RagA family TonB-linked outer membrane protein n=1 Tax=Reichenbachiella sp. TaxID=2184521 RepID=UPI003BB150D4
MNLKLLVRKQAKFKCLLSALMLMISFGFVQAQNNTVSGKVSGEGESLPGVNVLVKGTTTGVISDIEGNYKIDVAEGATLVFSFIGFQTQEVEVGSRSTLDVSLISDVKSLEEVVVIGYGSKKKKEVTGAVSNLSGDRITAIPVPDLGNALQGQIAGVNVQASSGAPGAQSNIQIRGISSLQGDNTPLFVVDGIPYSDNPNIAPSQIASIDVLKDAGSAAVYGVRGANGVILITTKQGAAGKLSIDMSSYYGIQKITSGTPLMGLHEQFYHDEIQLAAQNRSPFVLSQNPNSLQNNSDFVGDIQNDNAPIMNYDLNVSGGNGGFSFNANVNYFKQEGVLINSLFDRLSTRLTGNYRSENGKFSIFTSLGWSQEEREQEPWAIYENAIRQKPWNTPIKDLPEFGDGVLVPDGGEINYSQLSANLANTDETNGDRYNFAMRARYQVIDGLNLEVRLGQNTYQNRRVRFEPKYLVYNNEGLLSASAGRPNATLRENYLWRTNRSWENVLSYQKDFGKHSVSFTGVLSYEDYVQDQVGVSVSMSEQSRNFIQVLGAGETPGSPTSDLQEWSQTGKYARVEYDFADRYLISMGVRYDGSSRFSKENRYEAFPSVSLGWNVAEESFFNVGFINDLKFRASWGTVGNSNIAPYSYTPIIESGVNYLFGAEEALSSGLVQRTHVDPDLKWETSISKNIGLDAGFINNKLQFTADYYITDSEDMLLGQLLPLSAGTYVPGAVNDFGIRNTNAGNMTNKGIELALSYRSQTSFGLEYSISGTFTRNRNTVTSLNGPERGYPGGSPVQTIPGDDNTTFFAVGYPAGAFFLIPTNGIIKTPEQLAEYQELDPDANMGDLMYVNTDTTDMEINDNDRVYMGSGQADFEMGINVNLKYKNFDFAVQGYYSHGAKVFNGAKMFAYARGRHLDLYTMYSPQNTESDIPIYRSPTHANVRSRSDYFLEDGTYFRIRMLSLGYNIKALQKYGVGNMRVYFSSLNPFTFTNYEGYDPEIGGNGPLTRGVDSGSYPITRQFMLGLELNF